MSHHPHSHYLEIVADSDATLLGRVCGIFGGLNLVPTRLESMTSVGTGSLHISIVIAGCTPQRLDLIHRKLLQLTSVQSLRFEADDPARPVDRAPEGPQQEDGGACIGDVGDPHIPSLETWGNG